ncbi:MAG: hypothetical protein K9M51_03930 [Candidatus Gracilibacteria bacterium]|nr:hypothetical protein [Candidatus Gracilibacteria bacterium]
MIFSHISYKNLNSRQKENYNFHKVSAVLANYGFTSIRLTDDWQGADFIASHIDGETFIKVQLKGRLTFDKKYLNKEIWVAFPYKEDWYLYPHDDLTNELKESLNFKNTTSWQDKGAYSYNSISKPTLKLLSKYKL